MLMPPADNLVSAVCKSASSGLDGKMSGAKYWSVHVLVLCNTSPTAMQVGVHVVAQWNGQMGT